MHPETRSDRPARTHRRSAGRAPDQSGQTLISAYLDARYRIETGADSIELRIGWACPLPAPAPDRVQAVLSACNPGSRLFTDADNHTRSAHLQQQLDARGLPWRPALNQAADGSWPEPSCWLPAIPLSELDRLADASGQNACVVVHADRIARLRMYRRHGHTRSRQPLIEFAQQP